MTNIYIIMIISTLSTEFVTTYAGKLEGRKTVYVCVYRGRGSNIRKLSTFHWRNSVDIIQVLKI